MLACQALPGPAKWSVSIKSQLSGLHRALQGCSVDFPHPWRHLPGIHAPLIISQDAGFLEANSRSTVATLFFGQNKRHLNLGTFSV